MTEIATRSAITLKGSSKIIQEFFHYGIHSILYQRGIYPSDNFEREKKYGMTLFVSSEPKLQKFLKPLLEHVEGLLATKKLKKLVLVITDVATKEVYERWQFDIESDPDADEATAKNKDEKRIKQEMSDVIRQITASVAFLPLLETRCAFDVLVYTGRDTTLPEGWADSSECRIDNAEQVQLRSFSTAIQTVHTKVQYKADL
ncbi:HORMA domain-containing protein [Ditylenchus destructor]|nr:HORMA domain-containing protein [Ditylenchus destructor]